MQTVVKREWNSPFPVVYFDNAGRSHQPNTVEESGVMALRLKSTPWQGLPGSSSSDVQELRQLFSSLINAEDTSTIALCPSTAFAMTMISVNVMQNNLVSTANSILVLEKDMASVIYPWQNVCEMIGCSLRVVPTPDWSNPTASWVENILNELDDNVAVLSLPHVHWCDGTLIDLHIISRELYKRYDGKRKPLLIVDGTQSIGALPFDVSLIKADAVACSVHKWLLSPYGTSLVYVNPKYHQTWLPLDQHERAREGSENPAWDEEIFMNEQGFYPREFYLGARRLDAGGRPNPVWIPMIRSALHLIHEFSVSSIHTFLSHYCDMLLSKICLYPDWENYFLVAKLHQRGGHFLGLHFKNLNLLRGVHKTLQEHGVCTAIRGYCLRISPYLSNTTADANLFQALFFQAMQANIENLSGSQSRPLRILLTGACGWLAQFTFRRLLSTSFHLNTYDSVEIYGTYRESEEIYKSNSAKIPHWLLHKYRVSMDLSCVESVEYAVKSVKPDIILHLAALSSPVECHKDPERALLINAPEHLIQAVRKFSPNALFVFASTDMVYDGENPLYSTKEEPSAVNVYGATKREMEKFVSQLPCGVSLRLSNMVGSSYVYQQVGAKFLQFLWQQLRNRSVIGMKDDEVRSFVYVEDVVEVIVTLIKKWLSYETEMSSFSKFLPFSVFNVGGPDPLSRLALATVLGKSQDVSVIVTDSHEDGMKVKEEIEQSDKHNRNSPWVLFRMPETSPILENAGDWTGIINGSLRSPRNIAMDISATEKTMGFKFTSLDKVVGECLDIR